jgi:hypothetical protein
MSFELGVASCGRDWLIMGKTNRIQCFIIIFTIKIPFRGQTPWSETSQWRNLPSDLWYMPLRSIPLYYCCTGWLGRYRERTNEPHQRPLFVKALWYPINGIHGIILQVTHQIDEWVLPSTLQECLQQGPFLVYVDVIRRLDIKGQFRDYM